MKYFLIMTLVLTSLNGYSAQVDADKCFWDRVDSACGDFPSLACVTTLTKICNDMASTAMAVPLSVHITKLKSMGRGKNLEYQQNRSLKSNIAK